MAICNKCGATIKHVYNVDGKDYGSECYKAVMGIKRQYEAKKKVEQFFETNELTYICVDKDSYNLKEQLKAEGYKWKYGKWFGHKEVEGINCIVVNTKDVMDNDVTYNTEKLYKVFENYYKSINKSRFVGAIKDKIQIKVKLIKETGYSNGYGYTNIYTMQDEDGNIFTWKTTKDIEKDINEVFEIKGTIKDHIEYNYEEQTELTRCKVL